MASSTLTTDKRWAAPARKSGMTVLGKIPKPINLPSQRLENHGLDPSVEIVPKGTLMWGSKPTPAASNAWSSASLVSPKSDGGSGSLSHINARPSSGGGTRPSTAGSENSLDSPSAWGPNSRPSTASGALPSQHFTLAANCPQSAETRPGSSQLSRFADGSADNLKRPTSHGHGFTLSTSDFPTLGSEKNSESNSQQGHSLQGRPSSSSGREAAQSEYGSSVITGAGDVISSSHYQHVNTVKTEHAYDGVTPFPATNLPREAQQAQAYPPNPYMPPPQFDSWHAPPGHPPGGIWHRGPAPRGPHRPVGPPGGFPVEPFADYGRFPPNSVAAARQGPDLDGYHPKNEDVYHPHSHPNSYVLNQPVVSVRPVYLGPMPYDGYYGSPRPTFSRTNERDPPFMGDPHQPGILSQFPKQNDNFNPGNSQSRQGKHGTIPKEHSELDRVHEAHRGQPKILIEHLDRSEDTHAMERKIQPAPPLLPNPDGNWTDVNVRRDTRDTFGERDRVLAKSMPDQSNLPVAAGRNQSSCSENARPHPRETDDFILRKELKEDHSVVLDQQPIIEKNAALIEKIESLNNKARNVDGLNVAKPSLSKEAKLKQPKTVDPNADHVTKDVSSSAVTSDIAPASGRAASVSDSGFPVVQNLPKVRADGVIVVGLPELQVTEFGNAGKLGESACYHAYKREISSRNRRDGPAKDGLAHISGHGWKGHSTIDPLSIIDSTDAQHGNPSSENASQQLHVAAMDEMSDLPDYEAQHARMRELAVQRAKQRQQEEQERTRQQKEKALAKLEELNRRSSAEGQKNSNDALPETGDVHDKQEAGVGAATNPDTSTGESCGVVPAESLNALLLPNEPNNVALPVESKSAIASHAAGACKDPDIASSAAKNTDIEMTELVSQKSTSQSHDSSAQKQRQMGYRRRQAIPQVKIPREKSNIAESIESCRNTIETSVDAQSADPTPHEYPSTQNKKNNRHSRSKKKVDDCPVRSTSPPMVLHEHNTQTPVVISSEPNTQTPAVVVSSERQTKAPGVVISSNIVPAQGTTVTVGSITFGDVSLASVNQEWIKAPEDGHNTANSRPKPQQIKRSGKNQHGAQPVEKPHGNECVTWVPVKQPRKNEQSNVVAAPAQQSGKNISDMENVTRAKRAEMERYIPKPLSKELQNQVASVDTSGESNFDTKSHDKEVLDKSTATKAEAATELKKRVDKKTNRGHGRPHASWCRRNTDELALEANVEKHSDQRQPLEPEKQAEKQFKSEGHDAADNNSAPTQTTTNTNRQRQYPPKRNEDLNPPDDKNTSISEIKNTVAGSYPRAHWKPKSSSNIQKNPQDSNVTEEQVDSHGGRSDMDNSQASGRDGEKNAHSEHGKGDIRYEDNNLKSHSHEDTEQQQLNPALRHHGQHSGRYHRGGSVYRGRGHDAGKPSHPTNRERRKGSMHLEYQLVGSYNNLTNIQQNPRVKNEPRGI